jgi:5-methylcytosine-specific restriction endonuclease McrA
MSKANRAAYRQIRAQRLAAARALGTHTADEWQALVSRFAGRCVRCGASDRAVEKDHIKPLYQGGSDAIDNLQPLCARCNCAKGPEATNWAAYREEHGFDS